MKTSLHIIALFSEESAAFETKGKFWIMFGFKVLLSEALTLTCRHPSQDLSVFLKEYQRPEPRDLSDYYAFQQVTFCTSQVRGSTPVSQSLSH